MEPCCKKCETNDGYPAMCMIPSCSCHTSNNQKEESWVRDYIKKSSVWGEKGVSFLKQATIVFIRESLPTERKRLVERLEGMKQTNTKEESTSDWFYGYGFNAALDDIIRIIQEG